MRRYPRRFAHLWDCLKQAVFPLKCLNCGGRYQAPPGLTAIHLGPSPSQDAMPAMAPASLFKKAMAAHICPACAQQFIPTESPLCVCCGIMFAGREGGDHVCGECLGSKRNFDMARAAGVYGQALMAAIHRFKYGHRVNLARPLALLLLHAYCRFWHGRPVDTVIPVPLYRRRFRQRGFNQVYLAVRPWADPYWRQVLPKPLTISRTALQRKRPTSPQTGLGRQDRKVNVRNAFVVNDADTVRDKKILLVDDVYTTGATVNECARILMNAGADRVDVLTMARAI